MSSSTQSLIDYRAALLGEPSTEPCSTTRCDALTAYTETWLIEALRHHFSDASRAHMIVWALGSFGRRELCPHSDLDVLVEVEHAQVLEEPEFVAGISALMDAARALRLRLKHAVRTPDQHRAQLEQDWRTPIAMLDARAILDEGGRAQQSSAASDALALLRGDDHGASFIDRLIEAHIARRSRQNQSVYLLEPDIKSGLGALRDIHTLHWASIVRFGAPAAELDRPEWDSVQRERYLHARRWLLDLRLHIHSLNTRPQDRLRFPEQRAIAQRLFAHEDHPTETLLREHYSVTRGCLQQLDRALRQWGSPRWIDATMNSADAIPGARATGPMTPSQCLDVLAHASTHSLTLGPALEQRITDAATMWPHPPDEHAYRRFFKVLTDPAIDPSTSSRLLDLGLMTYFLPEFKPLVCHVQHDTYHVYTTDVHTLKCLERARALLHDPSRDEACSRWPAFVHIAEHIEHRHIFLLAALLHDIGKNRGGDHSNRGADLVPAIASRLTLSPRDAELLELLVRHHLLLSNTSRRRDITDPRVLDDVLDVLEDERTVTLLTSLTFCDMSTVSTTSMNDWRAGLLLQLHHGLLGELAQRTNLIEQASLLEQTALPPEHIIQTEHPEALERFIEDVPMERLQRLTHATYQALFDTYQEHAEDTSRTSVTVRHVQDTVTHAELSDKIHHQVIVATRDIPGALAKIAGVLSAQGLNILSAEILSTRSGTVLDLFHVEITRQTPREGAPAPVFTPAREQRLITQLCGVLDGQLDVEEQLARRRAQQLHEPELPQVTIEVKTYQDVSDDYTVIEVHAPDRRGLLYDIARVMHAQHVEVRLSKLDLLGNQAIDTFYVESMFSGKLSKEQAEALQLALDVAMRAPSPDWVQDEP